MSLHMYWAYSQPLLQSRLMEIWLGIKSSWSAHVLLFIGQIRKGVHLDPGRSKNRPKRDPLHERRGIVIFDSILKSSF